MNQKEINRLQQQNDAAHVPLIDIGPYLDGSDKEGVAKKVFDACRDTGFFLIKNHGVPQSLIDEIFKRAHEFFELPEEAKLKVKGSHNRGYFTYGEENLTTLYPALNAGVDTKLGDFKEGFDVGREKTADDPDMQHSFTSKQFNKWPEELGEAWKESVMRYFSTLNELGVQMMRIFAIALGLPESYFDDKVDHPTSSMRLLHYPPTSDGNEDRLGAGAHSDYGCLTLLAQDERGGLQLLNSRTNEFVDIMPIPNTFVVNVGDVLQRWTNNMFISTVHRVKNPPRGTNHRFSVPFFFDPNFDLIIECLPTCHSESNPARFPPVRFGDYLEHTYNATWYLDQQQQQQQQRQHQHQHSQ